MFLIYYGNVTDDKWFPPSARIWKANITVHYQGEDVTDTCYVCLSVFGLGFVDCFKRDKNGGFYWEPGTNHAAKHPRRWGKVIVKRKKAMNAEWRKAGWYERITARLRRRARATT